MPVLFTWRKPHDVTGPDLFYRSAPALRASETGSDDQRLPERMGVPRGARAGLERHGRAGRTRGRRSLKQRIDTDGAGEPFTRAISGCLRTSSFDVHETPQPLSAGPAPDMKSGVLRRENAGQISKPSTKTKSSRSPAR